MPEQLFLPLFPLPDLTLFPHTMIPLHIFEPRYRAMVTDALERDRRIGVVGLRPGHEAAYHGRPPIHTVGGAGEIVRCERLASGRFNVVVRGEHRIRVEAELPADTLYRFARVRVVEEQGADAPAVAELAGEVRQACRLILRALGRPSSDLDRVIAEDRAPGVLADQVTSAVVPDPAVRQRLLEEPDVERRLRGLTRALARLLERLKEGR